MKTLTQFERENISALAQDIVDAGYRVFIAQSGTYGFYATKSGHRTVSFQAEFSGVKFTGNANIDAGGTGWGLHDEHLVETGPREYAKFINELPPRWATKGRGYTLTTLERHLAIYQSSSRFLEISNTGVGQYIKRKLSRISEVNYE